MKPKFDATITLAICTLLVAAAAVVCKIKDGQSEMAKNTGTYISELESAVERTTMDLAWERAEVDGETGTWDCAWDACPTCGSTFNPDRVDVRPVAFSPRNGCGSAYVECLFCGGTWIALFEGSKRRIFIPRPELGWETLK
jgi:hypothetical protein